MLVNLTIGDWSADGHGQTESLIYNTNLSSTEVKDAYKIGTSTVGFNFCETVALGYDDCKMPLDKLARLRELGFDFDDGYYFDEDDPYIDPELFASIYLFIVKLGNSEAVFERFNVDTINIGGYGLFAF
jgi:hypothetical protein